MAKSASRPYATRLPDDARAELQALARAKGLTESDLGRMFILEKLAELRSGALVPLEFIRRSHAVTIAALSEQLDYVDALEVLSRYLDAPSPVTP